jgi:hypothetical protein
VGKRSLVAGLKTYDDSDFGVHLDYVADRMKIVAICRERAPFEYGHLNANAAARAIATAGLHILRQYWKDLARHPKRSPDRK